MKYCKSCEQNVQPTKKFSIVWFLINCLWLVGGVVYILYYLFGKSKVCPICGGKDFEAKVLGAKTANQPDNFQAKMKAMNDKFDEDHAKSVIRNANLRANLAKRKADRKAESESRKANIGIGDSLLARMQRDNIESARKRAEKKRLKQDKKLA